MTEGQQAVFLMRLQVRKSTRGLRKSKALRLPSDEGPQWQRCGFFLCSSRTIQYSVTSIPTPPPGQKSFIAGVCFRDSIQDCRNIVTGNTNLRWHHPLKTNGHYSKTCAATCVGHPAPHPHPLPLPLLCEKGNNCFSVLSPHFKCCYLHNLNVWAVAQAACG